MSTASNIELPKPTVDGRNLPPLKYLPPRPEPSKTLLHHTKHLSARSPIASRNKSLVFVFSPLFCSRAAVRRQMAFLPLIDSYAHSSMRRLLFSAACRPFSLKRGGSRAPDRRWSCGSNEAWIAGAVGMGGVRGVEAVGGDGTRFQ